MEKYRILVTNDDGIASPGVHILAESLKNLGQVCVIAPEKTQNAMGHSLTLHKPLRAAKHADLVYAVSGTPTDCVALGVHELFPSPDLVVSGINKGANLADDVTYSGTVSAAMEGVLFGVPSIAVSMFGEPEYCFKTAAEFIVGLARKVLKEGLPEYTLLNVNVPNLEQEKVKGYRFTKLGKRRYTKDVIVKKEDPRGRAYFWIGGEDIVWDKIDNCDYDAIVDDMISITPIKMDMTDTDTLLDISSWKID